MNRTNYWLATALIAASLGLYGCSGSDEAEQTADAAEPEAAKDHVWKEQVDAIDRAKGVEQTLKENDEAKRKAMKDAGGG